MGVVPQGPDIALAQLLKMRDITQFLPSETDQKLIEKWIDPVSAELLQLSGFG